MAEFSKVAADRRKEPRARVTLQGRYMLANRNEYPCTVIDASASAIALSCPERGAIGEAVVLYIDHFGRLEGNVVRHVEDGFVVKFKQKSRAAQAIAKLVDGHPSAERRAGVV